MNYKAQEHRYIYPGSTSQGHIFTTGADKGYCGIKKETLSKKAKEIDERLATTLRFRDGQELCSACQNKLKQGLAEKYNLDW